MPWTADRKYGNDTQVVPYKRNPQGTACVPFPNIEKTSRFREVFVF